jgi:putative phosphoesterase
MKLLVMSDSHHNVMNMLIAVKETEPDAVVHLGDNISDAVELQQNIPDTAVYMGAGNCDPRSLGQEEMFITIENIKMLMTHGHKYGVKTGLSRLLDRAINLGADIVLFGHTHIATWRQELDVTLVNPGQMKFNTESQRASYCILNVNDGVFECEIVYLPIRKYDDVWDS